MGKEFCGKVNKYLKELLGKKGLKELLMGIKAIQLSTVCSTTLTKSQLKVSLDEVYRSKVRKIATPLPPKETFLDDPLPVLRVVRFDCFWHIDIVHLRTLPPISGLALLLWMLKGTSWVELDAQIPVANYIFRNSLKLKASDAKTIFMPQLLLAPNCLSYHCGYGAADLAKQLIGSLQNVLAGCGSLFVGGPLRRPLWLRS
ncbi:hypothetical protein C5167_005980 [Papaver somniferum]|uniref:Uncharacterized protein n=1 Tax=Papaver somniferum TaxID=3469 RepID=A0A4Y7JDR0_PAPSO|nr:hypothetical protein C5167_005980 [Papaver somniferum]